jgi:hypothetical protein
MRPVLTRVVFPAIAQWPVKGLAGQYVDVVQPQLEQGIRINHA